MSLALLTWIEPEPSRRRGQEGLEATLTRARGYELFIALRPTPADTIRLAPEIRKSQDRFRCSAAKSVKPALWHVTLVGLARFDEHLPQQRWMRFTRLAARWRRPLFRSFTID
jgi:2'-5' RNA ligase